jgi:methyl-accepting chemotaxis protein
MTIKTKLFASAGVLLALIALVGLLSFASLRAVGDKSDAIYAEGVVPLQAMGEVRARFGAVDKQLLRAIVEPGEADYAGAVAMHRKRIDALVNGYATEGDLDEKEQAALQSYLLARTAYRRDADRVLALVASGDVAQARAVYLREAGPGAAVVDRKLEDIAELNSAEAEERREAVAGVASLTRDLLLSVLLVAFAAGLLVSWLVSRGIVDGLRKVLAGAKAIGDGDLTANVHVDSEDEIGELAAAFRAMAESLRGLVGTVSTTASHLGSASQQMASTSEETGRSVGEIANAVGDVAAGAERQVRKVEEARQATEEVSSAAQEGARSALETAEVARLAQSASDEGADAVAQAAEAIAGVRDTSTAVTEAIQHLAAKSTQIGGIVETITGIAGQTNLLALNAAIEAARAGEQGRGFAVVADEVRKLAEESQRAAASIAGLVEEIQGETQRAVDVVEDGARRTQEGVAVVDRAREAFERIGASVSDMTARVEQIAGAIQQIAASSERMHEGMGEVAAVAEESSASTEEVSATTEQTSASAQQIASSAQELARSAEELERVVGRFKLAA